VFPLNQIADFGVNLNRCFKLFGRKIISEVFQAVLKNIPEHHRQTDGLTDDGITVLCVALRSKNRKQNTNYRLQAKGESCIKTLSNRR